MPVLGLTGGSGSGKSTVAARLRELGAHVIDADRISREIVKNDAVKARIARRFGDRALADGELDRSWLAHTIYADPSARKALNAIVHPEVKRRFREETAKAHREDPSAVVVWDVPLLVETSMHRHADQVWLVVSPYDERIHRLMQRDGISGEEAKLRIAAQLSDRERARAADVIIRNAGTLEALNRFVDALYDDFLRMYTNEERKEP
ncbi:MAG: dephospho-CoA kinase [Clostridia bacterium]|nr:dephospho-CoA kinase [Clostridia bacterium]